MKRNQVKKLYEMVESLEEIYKDLESMNNDIQEKFDCLSERQQNSEKGEWMENDLFLLRDYIDSLQGVIESVHLNFDDPNNENLGNLESVSEEELEKEYFIFSEEIEKIKKDKTKLHSSEIKVQDVRPSDFSKRIAELGGSIHEHYCLSTLTKDGWFDISFSTHCQYHNKQLPEICSRFEELRKLKSSYYNLPKIEEVVVPVDIYSNISQYDLPENIRGPLSSLLTEASFVREQYFVSIPEDWFFAIIEAQNKYENETFIYTQYHYYFDNGMAYYKEKEYGKALECFYNAFETGFKSPGCDVKMHEKIYTIKKKLKIK